MYSLKDAHGNEKQLRRGTILETPDGDHKIVAYSRYTESISAVRAADYSPGNEWWWYTNVRQFPISQLLDGTIKFRGRGKLGNPVEKEESWMF